MAESTRAQGRGHAAEHEAVPREVPEHHRRHAELHRKAHRNEGEEYELRRLAKRIAAEEGA
jgi:hypothetical protein